MKHNFYKRWGAYSVAVPATTIIFSVASLALHKGIAGIIGGAVIGFLWAIFLGFISKRLMRLKYLRPQLANIPLFFGIIGSGLLIGGGTMYASLISAAMMVPSTTNATLSALMKPPITYFIAVNTPMETLIIPLMLFFNWDASKKRKILILIAALLYSLMRVWSYIIYVPTRFDISQHELSAENVQWFKNTMTIDYRGVMNIVTHILLILAAFIPVFPFEKEKIKTVFSTLSK
jgi:hypothetical protein